MPDTDSHDSTETTTHAENNEHVVGTSPGDSGADTAPDAGTADTAPDAGTADTAPDDARGDAADRVVQPDGGTVSQPAQDHQTTDYLESEVNLLSPSTPFMRDHLKVVWGTFIAWVLVVWGPVTATYFAPEAMTTTMPVIEFPLHYFLVALGAPTGSLILAAVYARQRDRLDRRYGIDPGSVETKDASGETAAADGGVEE